MGCARLSLGTEGQGCGGAGDVSCGLAGAGTDGARAGMGSWAVGRHSRAHVCTLALTENLADILGCTCCPCSMEILVCIAVQKKYLKFLHDLK